MSQVQLQVQPRRVRCTSACEPPPFQFTAGAAPAVVPSRARRVAQLPVRGIAFLFASAGRIVDAAFFLTMLTIWCALHLMAWSYAFQMGPAADCFGLSCPSWLQSKVIIGCIVLAGASYVLARVARRLGHRVTSVMLLLFVTLNVSALLLLGVGAII
jgi:hypothetical protein